MQARSRIESTLCSVIPLYQGSVHPLQDVALRITSPVVSLSAVDASVYKMSSYNLPLIAPLAASRVGNGPQKLQEGHLDEKTNLAASRVGNGPQKLQEGHLDEKTNLAASRAGHASPEATGRHL